jgi:peptidoglycan/xylan/chitin deacetylase (PgdA/CDA1 family)
MRPLLCLALVLCALPLRAEEASPKPPIVILKLDDVVSTGVKNQAHPVSARWQKVTDFLAEKKIKGSFGIIGWSLEEENPAYFKWIKDLQASGAIEFWNHGYYNKKNNDEPQEFQGTLEEQSEALRKTEALAREKLGFPLRVFGPHWSGTSASTEHALDANPDITAWYALSPGYVSGNPNRFAFERIMALENPTFVPDADKFIATYQKIAKGKPYLALQGHPNQWDDARWAGFVRIVEFLQAQGSTFMQPSEYVGTLKK